MLGWVIFVAAIVCNILGNYFIKRFSVDGEVQNIWSYLRPSFMFGLLFFGGGLLLYARALKDIPISLAYPIMVGVTMTALSLLAIISLGERVEFRDAIGAGLVLTGVALLSRVV
jgi:small multidrug resistance pump